MNVLFVTWDGPQVTYLESLFLPIFRQLRRAGFRFHVLQFTWGNLEASKARQIACKDSGVAYRSVTIWRRPLAAGSLLSAVKGALDIRKAIREYDIDVIMPRSTLPALATLIALRGKGLPIVFDADGLPLDERVDFAGLSPSSFSYRLLRDIEAQTVRRSSIVMTRSVDAVKTLIARAGAGTQPAKFHVVTNGRDSNIFRTMDSDFREHVRQRLGLKENAPLVIYAGSMGPKYSLGAMLHLFSLIRHRAPDAQLLILTGTPEYVISALDAYPELKPAITTMRVPSHRIPEYLACADLGLALIKPTYSMQAASAIKLGEYLLCGLPVVATAGIGDTSAVVNEHVGFVINDVDSDSQLEAAANWFVNVVLPAREAFRDRCRRVGIASFSLNEAVNNYQCAFDKVRNLTKERGNDYLR